MENIVRHDLNPVEEAQAFKRLLDGGMSVKELSETVGLPINQIGWRVQMLNAREDVLHLVAHGQMTPTIAWYIARLSPDGQMRALRSMTSQSLTYEAQVALLEQLYQGECQSEMFPEFKLTDEEVRVARQFRTAIIRAFEALAELQAMEAKNRGVISRAIATELDGGLQKLKALRHQISQVEKALTWEQARIIITSED